MERPRGRLAADIKRLSESLGPLPEPVVRPVLIVLVGLPGTGKSYLSAKLAQRLDVAVLESDALRKTLCSTPAYSWQESSYLFKVIHKLIEMLLKQNVSVILDATNLTESAREHLYAIAELCGAKLILVETRAPPDLVHARLDDRTEARASYSDADWSVYQKMVPTVERIRRRHHVVDTSEDIGPVVDKIVHEAGS